MDNAACLAPEKTSYPIHKNRPRMASPWALLMVGFVLILQCAVWAKAKEKVLYSFPGPNQDHATASILTLDKEGNLYGVADSADHPGYVFKLTHNGKRWSESIVYSFEGGNDGSGPQGGVIFDKAGNLYGVTIAGGNGCPGGCGTVFELTPSNGGWTESVLYSFAGGNDGASPEAVLVMDRAGNLYGTTTAGGDQSCQQGGCGTVFELTPAGGGQWQESVLHAFAGGKKDGAQPIFNADVILDKVGNLYGTTELGGKYNLGTVFELTPAQAGGWTETLLHSFRGIPDGQGPAAGLALVGGVLYGTTYSGGKVCQLRGGAAGGCGTVFQVTPGANGKWIEKVIHRFHASDGIESLATPALDPAGNLYGTTFEGGSGPCGVCGTAFELTPSANGKWTETVLHDFGAPGDAGTPEAGFIRDKAGHLFGTSVLGGANSNGTVYEISP